MATAAVTFDGLKKQIASGKLAPVYLLHGAESYYIDELVKEFEKVVPEADKEFNQYVLYAPQVEPGAVMYLCSRYPMMAERQVVILKECQAVRADQVNRLFRYVEHPSPTTVFVIVFRGDTAKGKDLMAVAKKHAVIFESKKPADYQLVPLISKCISEAGLVPDQKALEMLRDFIGTDLSRLYNEVGKLKTILAPGAKVTPEVVEQYIGVSKEFNNFELIDAISVRDAAKAFRIADYFAANPKANPLVMTTAALYGFFSDLMVAFYAKDKSDAGLMKDLNLKFDKQLRKFRAGMRSYNAFQVIEIISALRRFDAQSKGMGSRQNEHALFHDLIFHILSAPGNISF